MTTDGAQPSSQPKPAESAAAPARGSGFALLFLVFNVAYVLSPYWLLPARAWEKAVLLLLLSGIGASWAWFFSGPVRFGTVRHPVWFLLVILPLVAFNARALVMGIPWLGDEGFHFGSTIGLVDRLVLNPLIPVAVAASAAAFVLATRRTQRFGLRTALLTTGLIAVEIAIVAGLRHVHAQGLPYERLGGRTSILPLRGFIDYSLLRYPYLMRWCSALLVVIASPFMHVTPPLSGVFTEAAYRLVPLISALLTAWVVWRRLTEQTPLARWLLALMVGTTPLLVYYSSTLYLELPAVLLMTIVLFDARRLLENAPSDLRSIPSWYALLVIGFVKETTLPFLVLFLVCRLAGRARLLRSWRDIRAEAGVGVGVLLPFAIYAFFRDTWAGNQPYVPEFARLWEPNNYRILLLSYAQQFGPLGLLAIAGLVVMLVRRCLLPALLFVTVFLGDATFHLLDEVHLLGYSRFNLFLFPVVVVTATVALGSLPRRWTPATVLLALGVMGANLWLSPLHADGSKIPNWGDYGFDEAEHYYPYREAIRWLDVHHSRDRILVTGQDYSPEIYMYAPAAPPGTRAWPQWGRITLRLLPYDRTSTLGIRAPDNPSKVTADLAAAARDGFEVVLYHVMWGTDAAVMPRPVGWRLAKVFATQVHCLVVYERVPARAP
jgi:hypothetical protein